MSNSFSPNKRASDAWGHPIYIWADDGWRWGPVPYQRQSTGSHGSVAEAEDAAVDATARNVFDGETLPQTPTPEPSAELSAAYTAIHRRAELNTGWKVAHAGAWADAGAELLAELTATALRQRGDDAETIERLETERDDARREAERWRGNSGYSNMLPWECLF